MGKHNNLFVICDNCRHPLILSLEVETKLLPKTQVILCRHCNHENTDLEELKQYAVRSREYAGN